MGPEQLWTACATSLRAQVSDAAWRTWFEDARAVSVGDGRLVLAVPSSLVKERIQTRYLPLVRDALEDTTGASYDVILEVRTDDEELGEPAIAPVATEVESAASAEITSRRAGDRTEDLLNPRYTFEAFVTGTSNRFAHAAARSVAETPARSYNPLFIYGGSGLGKTHLLHAIGHYVRQNYPDRHVRYVSTEAFMNDFIHAVQTNTTPLLRGRYRECDVLLVDDIQFLGKGERTQEEFFHTFNALHGARRQIVITSDRPPKSIATLEERLRSRFEWGLVTDVQPPELETRIAILRRKADDVQVQVPDGVLEFIATYITDNIRVLEGALIRVTAFASLNHESLTQELAEKVLDDLLSSDEPRPITAQRILEMTADTFGFPVDELCGKSRRRNLVNARQIGMYVCRELTNDSYPSIAREFGGRDHTTVIHAVEKISGLMKEKRATYDQVTELIRRVKSGG